MGLVVIGIVVVVDVVTIISVVEVIKTSPFKNFVRDSKLFHFFRKISKLFLDKNFSGPILNNFEPFFAKLPDCNQIE